MSRPLVGVTAYHEPARWLAWDTGAIVLHDWYVDALGDVGAAAVLLPPQPQMSDDVLDRLDGLVLTGGPDVDPARYGQPPHPLTDEPRARRDEAELALYRGARKRTLPVLGICRGLQVMAVAERGRLTQHLPDDTSDSHRDRPGTFVDHDVSIAPGSRLQTILGDSVSVPTSHHQAVADPGGLTPVAWARDGTIEACEDPAARSFLLGVQWHPEVQDDRRVFAAFVAACAARAGQ